MSARRFVRRGSLRAGLVLGLVAAAHLVASPQTPPQNAPSTPTAPAGAQNVAVTSSNGTLPDGMVWRITMPTSGWNGTLLLDLDFANGGNGYIPLYNRGYAAAGITRIAFEQGGRDSRVSAAQLMQVLDIFTKAHGKPPYVIVNGGSTGGVVSGYTLEHYPARVDGAVANCTVPGYIPFLTYKLDYLFAAQVLLGLDPKAFPIVEIPANFSAIAAEWRTRITAAQATPEGRARIALAVGIGQAQTWAVTSLATPPDVNNLDQVQAYMFATLREGYGADASPRRSQEQQVGGKAYNWNTGVDYSRMFRLMRPEHLAAVQKFYKDAGLDLQADVAKVNNAPRIAADRAAVEEINLHGDYSGKPEKPFLINNLTGDSSVSPQASGAYVELVKKNGKGDLVRLIHVNGAGHCGFRANERVAAIEVMNERVRTGAWPSTAAAALNARASAIDSSIVPRFIDFVLPETGRAWFGTGDHYSPAPPIR